MRSFQTLVTEAFYQQHRLRFVWALTWDILVNLSPKLHKRWKNSSFQESGHNKILFVNNKIVYCMTDNDYKLFQTPGYALSDQ